MSTLLSEYRGVASLAKNSGTAGLDTLLILSLREELYFVSLWLRPPRAKYALQNMSQITLAVRAGGSGSSMRERENARLVSTAFMSCIWWVSQASRSYRSTIWQPSTALARRLAGARVSAVYSACAVSATSVGDVGMEAFASCSNAPAVRERTRTPWRRSEERRVG